MLKNNIKNKFIFKSSNTLKKSQNENEPNINPENERIIISKFSNKTLIDK